MRTAPRRQRRLRAGAGRTGSAPEAPLPSHRASWRARRPTRPAAPGSRSPSRAAARKRRPRPKPPCPGSALRTGWRFRGHRASPRLPPCAPRTVSPPSQGLATYRPRASRHTPPRPPGQRRSTAPRQAQPGDGGADGRSSGKYAPAGRRTASPAAAPLTGVKSPAPRATHGNANRRPIPGGGRSAMMLAAPDPASRTGERHHERREDPMKRRMLLRATGVTFLWTQGPPALAQARARRRGDRATAAAPRFVPAD